MDKGQVLRSGILDTPFTLCTTFEELSDTRVKNETSQKEVAEAVKLYLVHNIAKSENNATQNRMQRQKLKRNVFETKETFNMKCPTKGRRYYRMPSNLPFSQRS